MTLLFNCCKVNTFKSVTKGRLQSFHLSVYEKRIYILYSGEVPIFFSLLLQPVSDIPFHTPYSLPTKKGIHSIAANPLPYHTSKTRITPVLSLLPDWHSQEHSSCWPPYVRAPPVNRQPVSATGEDPYRQG